MSRIGNKPIAIPAGVEVKLNGNTVTVKGAKPFALVNDGEAEYLQEVSFEIVPASLRFIVPKESR